MPLEKRLIDRHVLDPDGGLVAIHVVHAIDQQEGIAVRQQLEKARDIGRGELPFGCRVIHDSGAPSHSRSHTFALRAIRLPFSTRTDIRFA